MKNPVYYLFVVLFTFSNYSYSQLTSIDNLPITSVFGVYNQDVLNEQNAITVPVGKLWYLNKQHGSGDWRVQFPNANWVAPLEIGFLLPEGTILYGVNSTPAILNIIEYDLDGQLLSQNNLQFNNKMKLFPNPTNSTLALNSDKDYEIEVYDMAGKKVMEAVGNTLDMSTLSNATYIIKAFDKATKETSSYKVVKN